MEAIPAEWQPKCGDYVIDDFVFSTGESLNLKQHYVTLGCPSRASDGAVVILHGTSADAMRAFFGQGASLESFSRPLFQAGGVLDATRHFIIVPDCIGYGQSSKPSDGLYFEFPAYTYSDMVLALQQLVVDHFKIDRLKLVMGISLGGMLTWQWGATFPSMVDCLMPLGCAPYPISGPNLYFRRIVIDALRKDHLIDGRYVPLDPDKPSTGALVAAGVFAKMISSPFKMMKEHPTYEASKQKFMEDRAKRLALVEPCDLTFALDASRDYDPEPTLSQISAKVFAANAEDDMIIDSRLGLLEAGMQKVPRGKFKVLTLEEASFGHPWIMQAHVWKDSLQELFSPEFGLEAKTSLQRTLLFLLTPLSVCGCNYTGIFYGWSAMLKPLSSAFADPSIGIYMFTGVMFQFGIINAVLAGVIGKFHPRSIFWFSSLCFAAGFAICGLAADLEQKWLCFAGVLVAGWGQSLGFAEVRLNIVVWYKHVLGRSGLGAAVMGLFVGLVSALYPPLVEYLFRATGGVSGVFYHLAWVVPVSTLPNCIFTPDRLKLTSAASVPESKTSSLKVSDALTDVNFYKVFLGANFLFMLPGWGIKMLLIPIFEHLFSFSAGEASGFASVFLVVYAVARFVLSLLADKVSPKLLMCLLAVLSAACFGLLLTALESWVAFSGLFLTIGICFAAGKSIVSMLIVEVFGIQNYPMIARLNGLALAGATVLGPLSATMCQLDQNANVHEYGAWFCAMAGVSLSAFLALITVTVQKGR